MNSETVIDSATSALDLSVEAERLVARQFMGRVQWEAVLIGLGQATIWMINLWCAFTGVYSVLVGFIISTFCCCIAYLPSHEGQHRNISGDKKSLRWLDDFVGHVTVITLGFSHRVLKVTHMKHHAHTNDPDKDVDVNNAGNHWWNPIIGVHRGIPKKTLEYHANEDTVFREGLQKGVPIMKAHGLAQLILVIFFPFETLFLIWLPRKIGFSYLAVFFAWYPHYPNLEKGRYKDTRFWRIPIPRYFCQSMQTHVIHHMYPRIPHWDEPKAMEALKPFMIERGIPGAEEIPDKVRFNSLRSG